MRFFLGGGGAVSLFLSPIFSPLPSSAALFNATPTQIASLALKCLLSWSRLLFLVSPHFYTQLRNHIIAWIFMKTGICRPIFFLTWLLELLDAVSFCFIASFFLNIYRTCPKYAIRVLQHLLRVNFHFRQKPQQLISLCCLSSFLKSVPITETTCCNALIGSDAFTCFSAHGLTSLR